MEKIVHRNNPDWGKSTVIVLDGGYALAMVAIVEPSKTAILHDVMVHESRRGQGLGTALLEEACTEAERMGAVLLRLSVTPQTWMEEWYERHGFMFYGFTNYEGSVYAVWEKPITRSDAVEPRGV